MTFGDVFQVYKGSIALGLSTAILVIAIWKFWDRMSLWGLNFAYSFPVFGKLNRLSRDLTRSGKDAWYKSEKTLCSDYLKHLQVKSRRDYIECQTYLEKAGDAGRSPFPSGIWVLIVALVFVEAMGFSYVLAGFTVPGASENVQQQASYGIAFMISILLVAFTHFAGHELFKSSQIRRARIEWREDEGSDKLTGTVPTLKKSLASIEPEHSQSVDDPAPKYRQLASRVGVFPSYWVTIITAVLIITVAIGATLVRLKAQDIQLTEETAGAQTFNFGNEPPELAGVQSAAQTGVARDVIDGKRGAGRWTFAVLAFVFVFLQLLGILFGFHWGFAGKDSALAFRICGGNRFSSFDEYKTFHYDRIVDVAQSKLETLRQHIIHRSEHGGSSKPQFVEKGFVDFVADRQRTNEGSYESAQKVSERVPMAQTIPPAPPPPPPPPPLNAPVPELRYYYTDGQNQVSTSAVTLSELRALFAGGRLALESWVRPDGSTQWVTYESVRET